ncbi:MAG: hypothetical protein AAFO94_23175, partial [Bacteroidota bacterium]
IDRPFLLMGYSSFHCDLEKADQYVSELLTTQLAEEITYHNLEHTQLVRKNANLIGRMKNLPKGELEIINLAALFHDTGFINDYKAHEEESKKIAQAFLQEHQYPAEKTAQVLACIDATKMGAIPTTDLAAVLKDGDLGSIGQEDFLVYTRRLRQEWKTVLNVELDDKTWYKREIEFYKSHYYFTPEARSLFGKQKDKNLKFLKKQLKKMKNKTKAEDKEGFSSVHSYYWP